MLKAYAIEHPVGGKPDFSLYRSIFKSAEPNNYCCYSGKAYNRKNRAEIKGCTQEEFCKYLKNKLGGVDFDRNDALRDMNARILAGTFLTKLRSTDNSLFPNALQQNELNAILANVVKFFPSLGEKEEDGFTKAEKISMLCSFRIPYYVGPLNLSSPNSWIVRKAGRILPWNFDEKVDLEKTAAGFMDRLVSTCSYLKGEKVLPKNSPYYQRFVLYNEVNKISLDGVRTPADLKNTLVEEYYVKANMAKVTKKAISAFIKSHTGENPDISGIDDAINASLKSEHQLADILGDLKKCRQQAEDIARILTVYSEDRRMLKKKLFQEYEGKLSKTQIDKLSQIKFEGWGNLSEKMLVGIYHKFPDGSEKNILTLMSEESLTLMELLSNKYSFAKQIEEYNKSLTGDKEKLDYSDIEELYCSPSVKHSIWRALSIVKEIVKITGHVPKKVFIETTREKRDDGRKESRKAELLSKYKKNVHDAELLASLSGSDDARLRQKKLFAYYSQLGRCAYCGKKIDLNDLANNTLYDLDHIYPQSKKTDDSIRNNMVLSCRLCNANKTNVYPISEEIQIAMKPFWTSLRDMGLMTAEKYSRLVRVTPFTEEELSGFISRQLVDTSQSVKSVAQVLGMYFGDKSEIVYVKGNNVSIFRNEQSKKTESGLLKPYYVKSRNVNDYHHAKDAYLNIVVGNVYETKFTKDPLNFLKTDGKYNLNRMYDYQVKRNGVIAWEPGEGGTIATVDKYMRRNNIQYTRAPYKESGALFNLQLMKKGNGQLPFKEGRSTEDYGAYNKVSGSYYVLVESEKNGKPFRTLESVPLILSGASSPELLKYLETQGLAAPKVLIPTILTDSLFIIDGLRAHLRSRSGDKVIYINGEQLVLPYPEYSYCKKLYNYAEAKKGNNTVRPEDYEINPDSNFALYKSLLSKIVSYDGGDTVYSKQSAFINLVKAIENLPNHFDKLDLVSQVDILSNILNVFQCKPIYADLKKYGGPGLVGRIQKSKNIELYESIQLVNQSITGLFEKIVDLKKV